MITSGSGRGSKNSLVVMDHKTRYLLVLKVWYFVVGGGFAGTDNIVITADGGCSHEIKRRLLLGRKVMTNLDSIFKSRDITLPTKVRLV